MTERKLYEYAVLRYVPQVHREEFINLGVILYCRDNKFLQIRSLVDAKRINAFYHKAETENLQDYLAGIAKIVGGEEGTIGKLSIAERFRWLTATRSSIVQCGKVHPGLCEDPAVMLEKLFTDLVL